MLSIAVLKNTKNYYLFLYYFHKCIHIMTTFNFNPIRAVIAHDKGAYTQQYICVFYCQHLLSTLFASIFRSVADFAFI